MDKLTDLQERFAQEYMRDLNASKAAERAGSRANQPGVAGHEFLNNPKVAARIAELQAERAEKTKIDAAWVLTRLADEATADIADIYDENGNLLPVREWPLIWRQGLVQGIEVEELFEGRGQDRERVGILRKVKLDNRVKRIELIGKHIGVQAFREQVGLSGELDINAKVDLSGLTDEQLRVLASIPSPDK